MSIEKFSSIVCLTTDFPVSFVLAVLISFGYHVEVVGVGLIAHGQSYKSQYGTSLVIFTSNRLITSEKLGREDGSSFQQSDISSYLS